jgi:hypothetical protein
MFLRSTCTGGNYVSILSFECTSAESLYLWHVQAREVVVETAYPDDNVALSLLRPCISALIPGKRMFSNIIKSPFMGALFISLNSAPSLGCHYSHVFLTSWKTSEPARGSYTSLQIGGAMTYFPSY